MIRQNLKDRELIVCSIKNLDYDSTSPESIESYVVKLENKIFLEVISEKRDISSNAVEAYANKLCYGYNKMIS